VVRAQWRLPGSVRSSLGQTCVCHTPSFLIKSTAVVPPHVGLVFVDGLLAQWCEHSGTSQAARVRPLGRTCVCHSPSFLIQKYRTGSSPCWSHFLEGSVGGRRECTPPPPRFESSSTCIWVPISSIKKGYLVPPR
jgi:hypothetical protein